MDRQPVGSSAAWELRRSASIVGITNTGGVPLPKRPDTPGLDEPGVSAEQASLQGVRDLIKAGRYEEALAGCEEALKRLSGLAGLPVDVLLTDATQLKGSCLGRLGRIEEGLGVWEEVISRFEDSVDLEVRMRVAQALNNRSAMLQRLGRSDQALVSFDELVSRFGDAREPRIRTCVSTGLSVKISVLTGLSRLEEADAACDELIARRDDGLNAGLDRNIARCMEERLRRLERSGRVDEQVRICAELRTAFGDTSDPAIQLRVLDALSNCASDLGRAGRSQEALAMFDEIESRFGDAPQPELRSGFVTAMMPKAALLARIGRVSDAIGAYDQALSLIGDAAAPEFHGAAVAILFGKGQALRLLGRPAESIVVLDGAVSTYRSVRAAGGGTKRLGAAVAAIMAKLEQLCEFDRGEEARGLSGRLNELLGDVVDTPLGDHATEAELESESDLAAVVADVFNSGECWPCFEATEQTQPLSVMAERASELYRLTEPWVFPGSDASSLATHAAAGIVRAVADGYAQLARAWPASDRVLLLLPRRTDEWITQVRDFHVDEWAAEHGYPLTLPEPIPEVGRTSADAQQFNSSLIEEQSSPQNLVRFFLKMTYSYELLGVLNDSPTGRAAMKSRTLKDRASFDLLIAKKWLLWLMRDREDQAGAAAACVYIAQQLFLASHAEIPSNATPLLRTPALRGLLRESGSYHWLISQAAPLPDWVAEEDE